MEWVGRLKDLLSLQTKHVFVVWAASGCLLFLPQAALSKLHVASLQTQWGSYVGVIFLLSAALLAAQTVSSGWSQMRRRATRNQWKRGLGEAIERLDVAEQAVLREFLFGQTTIQLPADHPVVAGLISKGLLRQVGRLGERSLAGILISLRISEDVESRMTPAAYGIADFMLPSPDSKWRISDEGIAWLRDNRPPFMYEIQRREERYRSLW
jgi:hypothetical protein